MDWQWGFLRRHSFMQVWTPIFDISSVMKFFKRYPYIKLSKQNGIIGEIMKQKNKSEICLIFQIKCICSIIMKVRTNVLIYLTRDMATSSKWEFSIGKPILTKKNIATKFNITIKNLVMVLYKYFQIQIKIIAILFTQCLKINKFQVC